MSKMVQSAQQILARPFTRTVGSAVDRISGRFLIETYLGRDATHNHFET